MSSGAARRGGRSQGTLAASLFCLWYFAWHLQINSVQALHFAKASEDISIPHTFPIEKAFFEAYVLRSASESTNSSITFHFKNSTSSTKSSAPPVFLSSLIGIQTSDTKSQKFQLVLLRPLNKTKKKNFNVSVCAKNHESSPHHSPCINVKVKVLLDQRSECNLTEMCFGQSVHLRYKISENNKTQAIARLAQPAYQTVCKPKDVTYSVKSTPDDGTLNVKEGVLEFTKILDREKIQLLEFQVICNVTFTDHFNRLEMKGVINVTDENEHGPLILKQEYPIIIKVEEVNDILKDKNNIGIDDQDAEPSPYQVEIIDDRAQFFNVTHDYHPYDAAGEPGFFVLARLHPVRKVIQFAGTEYEFGVRFKDVTLHVPSVNPEVVVRIKLTQDKSQEPGVLSTLEPMAGKEVNATVSNRAAQYSKVIQPIPIQLAEPSGAEFFLDPLPDQLVFPLPFDVTPRHGIVYINDSKSLLRLNLTDHQAELQFKLRWKAIWAMDNMTDSGYEDGILINIIVINVEIQGALKDKQQCGQSAMCSQYDNKDACSKNCGHGAINGHCQWHDNVITKLSSYATCSPDLNTCPDRNCDELESLFPNICLQDCVENPVVGTNFGPRGSKKGIGHPVGTCTCAIHDGRSSCRCHRGSHDEIDHPDDGITKSINGTVFEETNTETVDDPVLSTRGSTRNEDDVQCGFQCIASISAALVVILMVVSACCVYCKKNPHKLCSKRHKYPGSLASLPAVPSDYVDERSSSIVSQNVINNELLISISNKFMPIDSKWEFSRNRLIIEQTLGEGEFGRVMKARALDISSTSPGYSTVAVKMLKSNGSSSEQDLLSEFNLLKEVSHPNVIKLLGACSAKDGPLLIIVEYAEFGSLRSYLRKTRRLECKSCTSDDSGVDSMANGSQADHPLSDYQVNPRDLLSFGWQIAKGMAYLSDMKLVHRDLAARNILVASGKVVKISDFGLTRDVYEGDAYFKKSMGRVPVKWMAIESLLDHIYTTKSDVWSFGIVLWEIVTLGAAPYPGVVAERLFSLLKTGYRMEKPENCSDELYNIMRRCWQEHPHDRPPFSELTKVFDNMLQANVEYLDLGLNMVHNMTYFDDTPALTDTIGEEAEEGEESEMGYGSLNVLPTDDSEYLQSNPRSVEDDEEDAFLLTKSSYEIARTGLNFKEEEHAV